MLREYYSRTADSKSETSPTNRAASSTKSKDPPKSSSNGEGSSSIERSCHQHCWTNSLFGTSTTAQVYVVAENGVRLKVRALIDPASQVSFVSSSLCQELHIKSELIHAPIPSVGDELVTVSRT
ncbi:hypothetical protein QAD02_021250 [Eretmocerus hayati]|uniref:Uncharacterized protein n=1 Tax=Eretmocerus hayati TaxID=131215 RepID=A0ACC2PPX7_9HYME|nr:hypothetical protein QAD02_021250 [Eretmocerus hayati]